VAYLSHARMVVPQNQSYLSNTCTDNGTVRLCNPFLGYGSANSLPCRRSDVTLQQYWLGVTWIVLCVIFLTQQCICVFCVVSVEAIHNESGCNSVAVRFIREVKSVPDQDKWMQWQYEFRAVTTVTIIVTAETRERIGTRSAKENKRSACEEFICD
jgi:hypothetical protein